MIQIEKWLQNLLSWNWNFQWKAILELRKFRYLQSKLFCMRSEMKQSILSLFSKNPDYSISEIISELQEEGFDAVGNQELCLRFNLLLWHNVSQPFESAFHELLKEGKIELQLLPPTSAVLVYAYSGEVMALPVAKVIKDYTTRHWYPTVVKLRK
jgi:hypothetical protein